MHKICICLIAGALSAGAAEWNQWRGPNRNGLVPDQVRLDTQFPESGPKEIWRSEPIPSNDDGGHGSLVISGNRIYMGIVWHKNIPSEKRELNELVVRRMGFRNLSQHKGLADKMEEARLALSSRLRGAKLEEWADAWLEEHLDPKQQEAIGGWIKDRFKKGKSAVPYGDLEKISKAGDLLFENDKIFKAWIEKQGFSKLAREQLIKVVPSSIREAKDVVICIDGTNGKTLWRSETPGHPTGRKSSSTPCVANGKVYAAGSTHAHCVDAKTGKPVWSVKLPSKPTASSFLVADGRAFIMAGRLVALNAETGREIWQSEDARGGNSSPMIWEHKGHQFIIISAGREVFCLNPSDGSVVWSVAGGGDSTPVIYGDWLVSYSRDAKIGLAGYKLSLAGAEMIWNLALDARRSQSTPIIYQKHVYLAGGENQLCLELATGKVQWREKRQSTISSPLIADGKFILMEKKGSDLVMLEATPEAHREIAKTRVKAMWCPSPVISKGRLYLRRENHVVCFNLALRQLVP